jgi:hypothetical protein
MFDKRTNSVSVKNRLSPFSDSASPIYFVHTTLAILVPSPSRTLESTPRAHSACRPTFRTLPILLSSARLTFAAGGGFLRP